MLVSSNPSLSGNTNSARQQFCKTFLDASSHLYKSVCPSVGPLVGNAFVKNRIKKGFCGRNDVKKRKTAYKPKSHTGGHLISGPIFHTKQLSFIMVTRGLALDMASALFRQL